MTKQQIINGAIAEFGVHSYAEASANEISKKGNISKGIIYHYFKNKDDLYLVCVKECFDNFTSFLASKEISFTNVEESIERYLDLRFQFFKERPFFRNIFTNVLLQPPKHLIEEISEIKKNLDKYNISFYEKVLDHMELKDDVSRKEAIEYFMLFQESFNHQFWKYEDRDYGMLFDEHEFKLRRLLKFMFYGILKEETQE
nr:TetR/AcrR family transcriptional regulator [Alkalibacter mobilis]